MAKIDVSKITGYSEMSAEDKIAALESFEYDDGMSEIERYKTAVSKANSDVAEWKRKHNALLSEEEKKKAEEAEKTAQMVARLEQLEKEKAVATYQAKFTALGYDADLAMNTANAYADGDMDTVFANQKKFIEKHDKDLLAEKVKDFPKPVSGGAEGKVTKEKFLAMSTAEQIDYKANNPNWINELK